MFVGAPLVDIVSVQTLLTLLGVSGNQQRKLVQSKEIDVSNLFTNLVKLILIFNVYKCLIFNVYKCYIILCSASTYKTPGQAVHTDPNQSITKRK